MTFSLLNSVFKHFQKEALKLIKFMNTSVAHPADLLKTRNLSRNLSWNLSLYTLLCAGWGHTTLDSDVSSGSLMWSQSTSYVHYWTTPYLSTRTYQDACQTTSPSFIISISWFLHALFGCSQSTLVSLWHVSVQIYFSLDILHRLSNFLVCKLPIHGYTELLEWKKKKKSAANLTWTNM